MKIYPAIDLYEGKAVRLFKGDYAQMTVYGNDPAKIALDFRAKGADRVHVVDLEGAKNGTTPNFDTVCRIKNESGLFVEIGGGIRSFDVMEKYFSAGIDRVILGTAAVTEEGFVKKACDAFGKKIAVGVDLKDGFVAIKGWTENSERTAFDFCREMQDAGVSTVIVTDVSKDGTMQGTNLELYKKLSEEFSLDIIASGGVSDIESVKSLSAMGIHGAIIGKAYYTGAVDLKQAIEVAK